MNTKKIYDCFIFYNELDLLEIRLEETYRFVDYYVICEATTTFRGKPKPLFYSQNKARFQRFADKIIHVVVDDMPGSGEIADDESVGEFEPAIWNREFFQRNAIRRGLDNAKPDDVIIIADCDEIPNPKALRYIRDNSGYFILDMSMYQFYLNMRAQQSGWRKPFAYTYSASTSVTDYNFNRTNDQQSFEDFSGNKHYIKDAGWHFTFLGGMNNVKRKLEAYSHTDGWQRRMWNENVLKMQMIELQEVGGAKPLQFCRIDASFPEVVQRNKDRLIAAGYIKDEWARLQELEALWISSDGRHRSVLATYEQAVQNLGALQRAIRKRGLDLASSINLIPSSIDFAVGWDPGMQTIRASIEPTPNIPEIFPRNAIMSHRRNSEVEIPDPNVGYFTRLPVETGRRYTASCFIWLPNDYLGRTVDISLDGWQVQSKRIADATARGGWQRISATGTAPHLEDGLNLVLRAYGASASVVYSSCWQLEEGEVPTEYRATKMSADA